ASARNRAPMRPARFMADLAGRLAELAPPAIIFDEALTSAPDFAGDGSAISTIQALATAARYRIGAKFVVCNNRSYRIRKYNLRQYWRDRREPDDQAFPDSFDLAQLELRFDRLARGQGVDAIRVEHPADIAPALDRALADDKPFLIDVVLSAEL
ncbi:MAG: thiamine pyrophosphate-dependent enzyme, partial [Rhodoplanes sp.]